MGKCLSIHLKEESTNGFLEFEWNLNVDYCKIRRSIGMKFAITSNASVGAVLNELETEIEIDR